MFRYRYGGLIFRSPAPLPLMPESPDDGLSDVCVEFRRLPPPAAACLRAKPHFQMYADGTCVLRSPDGIRLLFDNGRTLLLEVPDGLDPRLVQSWFIGPGLGLILHQRRAPPLHACAVSLGGAAIAIAGDSGTGKSTTARALLRRGHKFLAEDQVIVDPISCQIYPGVPDLRLWADAARLFGDRIDEGSRNGSTEDKFTIAGLREQFDRQTRPLAAVFVLSPASAAEPEAERLTAGAAAAALHRYVYRVRLATFMGEGAGIFRWATKLTASVPVFSLRRPRDLSRLDELAALIERVTEQVE
jgi:hypothetical protein